jgi:hypothetical protein
MLLLHLTDEEPARALEVAVQKETCMSNDRREPLSSAELEQEAREKDRIELKASEAPGHMLPASEAAPESAAPPPKLPGAISPPD